MCHPTVIEFGKANLSVDEVRGKRIIEVGSHNINGSVKEHAKGLMPSEYIGIDMEIGRDVDIICNAEDIVKKFGKESFDIVISTEMLEHAKDWKKVISNIKHICKNGGIILITTRSYGFGRHEYPNDYWRYEISDIQHIFSDCIIEKIVSDTYHPGVLVKIKKPDNFVENDLSSYELYNIVQNKKILNQVEKKMSTGDNNEMVPKESECAINKKLLELARGDSKDVDTHPLISVRIATYNMSKLLTERAITSVLRQTYQNFEIIIVGDHCTDNTEESIKKLYGNDKRIKFYNLPVRGEYPVNPYARWCVAGTVPANKATELCSGNWIAPLDDDDEFIEDHLEVLLNHALKHGYELVYGALLMEEGYNTNKWRCIGTYPPYSGVIGSIATLYSSKLRFFKYDINAWKYGEPGDWNMIRRMMEAGVKIGYINRAVAKHYERSSRFRD